MTDVAVIGLGRIASGYDVGAPAGAVPRSHLGAILATPGLRLAAAIDPDPAARDAARAHWRLGADVVVAADLDAVPAGIAVAVVCTPSALRREVISRLLDKGVRLLVVEKPLALSLDEARAVAALVEGSGVELRVNFHRRFDPRLTALRSQIAGRQPRLVTMRYGKGLYNYGSHLVDLMLDWFGPVTEVQAIGAERAGFEPTLSFRCGLAAGFDTVVLGLDGLAYDQCEIEIHLPDCRLELVGGGFAPQWRRAEDGRFYPGYAHLGEPLPAAEFGPVSGLAQLWAAVVRQSFDRLPGCTAAEALDGMRILDAARLSAAQGGVTLTQEQWP